MFLFDQPENKWVNTCPSLLGEPILPLDAWLTVPSYIDRDHHHCQGKVYYIRTIRFMWPTKVLVFLPADRCPLLPNCWWFNFRQRNSLKLRISRAISMEQSRQCDDWEGTCHLRWTERARCSIKYPLFLSRKRSVNCSWGQGKPIDCVSLHTCRTCYSKGKEV